MRKIFRFLPVIILSFMAFSLATAGLSLAKDPDGGAAAPPGSRQDFFKKAGGLVLNIEKWPEGSEYSESALNPDGTYMYAEMLDALVYIQLERKKATFAADAAKVSLLLAEEDGDKPEAAQDEKLSERLTYPAYKAEFITGSNEDTRNNLAVYVGTDDWDFIISISVAADYLEEYEKRMKEWYDGLAFEEFS